MRTNVRLVHISIDDCFISLKRLSIDAHVSDLLDVKFFRYLEILHFLFNASFTLYLFYKDGEFSLSDVKDSYREEFEKRHAWLKFGFHSPSHNNPAIGDYDFEQYLIDFKREVTRFAGEKSIATINRQHYWYYPSEHLNALIKNGVSILLEKSSYNENMICDGLDIWKSHILLEKDKFCISGMKKINNKTQPLVVYTHEWALCRKNKIRLGLLVAYCTIMKYSFVCV